MVLVDSGAVMVKTTKAYNYRANMPEWLLVLQRHEEVKLFQGPIADDPYALNKPYAVACVVCSSAAECGHPSQKEWCKDHDIYVCKQCLSPWHKGCAERFRDGKHGELDALPDGFICRACPDCF